MRRVLTRSVRPAGPDRRPWSEVSPRHRTAARQKAEQAVLEIQGALVLTRALDDINVFSRALADSRKRLMNIK